MEVFQGGGSGEMEAERVEMSMCEPVSPVLGRLGSQYRHSFEVQYTSKPDTVRATDPDNSLAADIRLHFS